MHHQIMGYMVELVSQYILQLISSSISYSTIYDIQDNYAFESNENVAVYWTNSDNTTKFVQCTFIEMEGVKMNNSYSYEAYDCVS